METILTPSPATGFSTEKSPVSSTAPAHGADIEARKDTSSEEAKSGSLSKPLNQFTGRARVAAIVQLVLATLEDEKASDIIQIDLTGKSEIGDSMIIASGRSARHVNAVSDALLRALKSGGVETMRCEGKPSCDWVLVDAGDVIIHLFRPEVREFYNLERIWSEAARAPVKTSGSA